MSLLAVTIDLDEIHCYHEIHGLASPSSETAHAVYERALPRAATFFDELGIKATFFVVGKDLAEAREAPGLMAGLARAGHEVGNHTMNHLYDFTLKQSAIMAEEIDKGSQIIERLVGVKPRGFRAPGYNTHSGLFALLEQRDYVYDSSIFPCPLYYTAKAAAIGMKSLSGKKSSSVTGDPRVMRAPTVPYRIDSMQPWVKGKGLRELPITVVTKARLPYISGFLFLAGALSSRALTKSAASLSFVNLELHGIDFLDADGDGLGALKKHQPDLRIPLVKRQRILERCIKALLEAGLDPVTLQSAALRALL